MIPKILVLVQLLMFLLPGLSSAQGSCSHLFPSSLVQFGVPKQIMADILEFNDASLKYVTTTYELLAYFFSEQPAAYFQAIALVSSIANVLMRLPAPEPLKRGELVLRE